MRPTKKCLFSILGILLFIIIVVTIVVTLDIPVKQYFESFYELLFDDNTGAEFARNIFIAFFSVALGIPAGLEINRRWHKNQEIQRQTQLLKILRDKFCENQGYLKQILDEMNEGLIRIPSFPLDLVTLNGTSQYRHEIISNPELLREIDKAHFELIHVDRRLEILQLRFISSTATRELNFEESMHIHDCMKKYREFKRLYNLTFDSNNKRIPDIPLIAMKQQSLILNKVLSVLPLAYQYHHMNQISLPGKVGLSHTVKKLLGQLRKH